MFQKKHASNFKQIQTQKKETESYELKGDKLTHGLEMKECYIDMTKRNMLYTTYIDNERTKIKEERIKQKKLPEILNKEEFSKRAFENFYEKI